jgi:DNA invertase Pin-like site-specific DNA recombinase
MSSTTPIKKNTGSTFDGYIRVSHVGSRSGQDSYKSPEDQRAIIESLATTHGLTLAEVVIEEDVKGDTVATDRELGRLVGKIEAGQSAGLIVWEVGRYSRSLADGAVTADRIRKAGGRLLATDCDTAAPMGRALLGLMLGLKEEEHDRKKETWARTKKRALDRGAWVGVAPFGYRKVEHGPEKGALRIEETTAAILREVVTQRIGGASLYDLVDFLNERHLGGPSGKGTAWNRATVKKMLGRSLYYGHVKFGDYERRDESLAIITEAEFVAVSKINKKRGEGKARRGRGPVSLLAGSLVCSGCGGPMNRKSGGKVNNAKGYATYTCTAKERDRSCPAPATAMQLRLDALIESIAFPEFEGAPFESFVYSEPVPGSALVNVNTPEVEALLVELEAARTSREAFSDPAVRDALGTEAFLTGLKKANERIAEVEERLEAALAVVPETAPRPVAESEWRAMTLLERRDELSRRISRVVVRRTRPRVKGEKWEPLEGRISVEGVKDAAVPVEKVVVAA